MRFALLIDLDGTITEPAPGIIASIRHALSALRIEPKSGDDLTWAIGPPLRGVFGRLGVQPADIERAIALYRQKYAGGLMFDALIHDGMPEALAKLGADGHRLFVCTSKPQIYAKEIVSHFGLAGAFEEIFGSELDGRRDNKGDLIAHILAGRAIDPARAIMIGDTEFDVGGARANGVETIGVAWGHGGQKLAAARPALICAHPSELPDAARRLAARRAEDWRI